VKVRGVRVNNRRRAFEVRWRTPLSAGSSTRTSARRGSGSCCGRVARAPGHLRDQLVYALTLEAQKRVSASPLSRRELIRRLGTSATQFYRLLDQTNYRKSVDQLLSLLQILDCEVTLVVRPKTA